MLLVTKRGGVAYDPHTVKLTGVTLPDLSRDMAVYSAFGLGNKNPAKKDPRPDLAYLVLGHDCNYACKYCMQRSFRPAAAPMPSDADAFLAKVRENPGLFSETGIFLFWGGEPLLYWDAVKKITLGLTRENLINPDVTFVVSTNGSLMDTEKAAFMLRHGMRLALSHDGPGQPLRTGDPLGEENPVSRAAILDVAKNGGPGAFILGPTMHAGNASRRELLNYYAALFGPDFDYPINAYSPFFVCEDSHPYNPYLADPLAAMWGIFRECAEGIAERFHDFHWITGRYAHRLINQDFDLRDTFESNYDISNPKRIRINLAGELTAMHIGDFSPKYVMGTIDDMENLRLPEGGYLASSAKVRGRCANCPVLALCMGGDQYVGGDCMDADCLSKFTMYAPLWLYLTSAYMLRRPILAVEGVPYRHKALFDSFLTSEKYLALADEWGKAC